MPVIFAPGSTDDAEMCVSVTILSDTLVECDEYFTVMLGAPNGVNLTIGNDAINVTIHESSGMQSSLLTIQRLILQRFSRL